jgi:hypothetical protein
VTFISLVTDDRVGPIRNRVIFYTADASQIAIIADSAPDKIFKTSSTAICPGRLYFQQQAGRGDSYK